ncbi:hypothetical protein V1283_003302 [Bradyrhizobium sp. AZCC 2262]|uniref:hypothetical protein n=1 Tax=Bradyrhizobium sp. AZCC 2262 TaxID=3117022 RepID=UPI002FF422B1
MFRKKSGEENAVQSATKPDEQPVLPANTARAPAVSERLDCALGILAELEEQVAEFALEAAERKPGGAEKLAGHRAKIDSAKTAVDELRAAHRLAAKLDRQAVAAGAIAMRAEQMAAFKSYVSSREKAMKRSLDHAAEMARAFAEFSVLTEAMVGVLPTGTNFPTMTMGENGLSGNLLSSCEKLLLAEMYRLGEASNGRRAPLPFAKPQVVSLRDVPGEIPPGIEVLKVAHQAMLHDIEQQVSRLDSEQMDAATHGKAA